MRLCKRNIEYAGVADPSTPAEIRVEILGLRNAIKQAEELISRHEQALEIALLIDRFPMEAQHGVAGEVDNRTPKETQEEQSCPPLVR
jgi:FlaA1/EpsC-like NDP-sugar epimerase